MQSISGQIVDVTPLSDRISSFRITAAEGAALPAYRAGAHIKVTVADGTSRAYSLVDFAPIPDAPQCYTITVQREDDGQGGSRYMHGLSVGDRITFAPPKNDFERVQGANAVFLAGGIGVTPMISLATALAEAGQLFVFHYAGRTRAVMAYVDQLQAQHADKLHLHFDDTPDTMLDLNAVIGAVDAQTHLYVCGPRGMIDAVRAKAEAAGIDTARIHFELFENAAPQEGDAAFEVELASTGDVYTVAPGQSIIDVLEAAGVDVMYDCQRGDCGICQCDVISGEPDHRDVVLSEDERASGKVMQICVSRAKSPRLVLDI
jgi:vanillate O-demethylase ferredoxin subunit